jgi:hypothetical protein
MKMTRQRSHDNHRIELPISNNDCEGFGRRYLGKFSLNLGAILGVNVANHPNQRLRRRQELWQQLLPPIASTNQSHVHSIPH